MEATRFESSADADRLGKTVFSQNSFAFLFFVIFNLTYRRKLP